jgi:hypothetical protein
VSICPLWRTNPLRTEAGFERRQREAGGAISQRSESEYCLGSDIGGLPRFTAALSLSLSTSLICSRVCWRSMSRRQSTRWRLASLTVINPPIRYTMHPPHLGSMIRFALDLSGSHPQRPMSSMGANIRTRPGRGPQRTPRRQWMACHSSGVLRNASVNHELTPDVRRRLQRIMSLLLRDQWGSGNGMCFPHGLKHRYIRSSRGRISHRRRLQLWFRSTDTTDR